MLCLFTEQSCKNCYRTKINLLCYFCWCKSKIVKSTFQCLPWQKSVGPYSFRFALSVAWQNKMTEMLKVSSYCKLWKKISQITSSKNKHTLIFFSNRWLSVHFAEFSAGSVSLFLSVELFLGFWQTLHASLDIKKFLAGPLEAWLCVASLFALICLPCSQDTACSRPSFGSLQPGDPKNPFSFLLEEECKLQPHEADPSVFHCFHFNSVCLQIFPKSPCFRTGQCCKCLLNTPYVNCQHSNSEI